MNIEPDILVSVDLAAVHSARLAPAYKALCERVRAGHPKALAAEAIGIEWRHQLTRDEQRLLCLIRDVATVDELRSGSAAPYWRLRGERPWERVARLESSAKQRRKATAVKNKCGPTAA